MAQQQGDIIYVYDENNHLLWSKTGELYGYTSGIVTMKHGSMLYMYNDRGSLTGSRSCN